MAKVPSLGQKGEKVAANYLIARGYKILDANYFNHLGYRVGEIDLVAEDSDGMLVFVEVKSRGSNGQDVVPEENFTSRKMVKLTKAINYYLARKKKFDCPWRIDLIGVIFDFSKRTLSIKHTKWIH